MTFNMKTLLGGLLGLALVAGLPNAHAIQLVANNGDDTYVGLIEYGIPSGDQDREDYVNHLIALAPNAVDDNTANDGQKYYRSDNVFASLPAATFAANGGNSGSYNVGSGGYLYLFAKYDGPNFGSQVWYIGGLTGTIEIPTDMGQPGSGLSGVSFFNPGTSVPDGGTTAMLLGLALTGIAFLRRRV